MIEKPSILITSLGRTGTEFFARLFADAVPRATSLHEPDIFQNTGVESRLESYLEQVRRAGVWRMVVLKAVGKWTLVKLSDARFQAGMNDEIVLANLLAQREGFVRSTAGEVYVEANIGYYGLLDLTPRAFAQHRVLYFVRDGREWIRSHLNWGEAYNKRGLRKLISHNWPSPNAAAGDPYAGEWWGFSRFEKLCWAWSRLNQYALGLLPRNPHARLYRFEDVFLSEDRDRHLVELMAFATDHLPDAEGMIARARGQLDRRSHASSGDFPSWRDWTQEQKQQFTRICGPLMQQLGYDLN